MARPVFDVGAATQAQAFRPNSPLGAMAMATPLMRTAPPFPADGLFPHSLSDGHRFPSVKKTRYFFQRVGLVIPPAEQAGIPLFLFASDVAWFPARIREETLGWLFSAALLAARHR